MKVLVLLAVFGVALVYSHPFPQEIEIIRSENDNPGNGVYQWAFETSDGTQQEQEGSLRSGVLEDGNDGEFQAVQGSYSYQSPNGKTVTITYTADENGYRPKTTIS